MRMFHANPFSVWWGLGAQGSNGRPANSDISVPPGTLEIRKETMQYFQQCSQPCGFVQEGIGTGGDNSCLDIRVVFSAYHENGRRAAILTQSSEKLDSGHAGEVQVEDDQCRARLHGQLIPLNAIVRHSHAQTLVIQHACQRFRPTAIVVDNDHVRIHCFRPPSFLAGPEESTLAGSNSRARRIDFAAKPCRLLRARRDQRADQARWATN
jgi:hypothetical protein